MLAVTSRILLCFLGIYLTLPFSGNDASTFERLASEWSQCSISDIFAKINVGGSFLISSIIAFFYKILDRNIAIPIFINGILGILIFHYSIKLTLLIWRDKKSTKLAAIIIALHPMLNINSAVVLRENFVILFTIMASVYIVRYVLNKKLINIFFVGFFSLLAAFFHGGLILYPMGFILFLFVFNKRLALIKKLMFGGITLGLLIIAMNTFEFGKVGKLTQLTDVEYLAKKQLERAEANTVYLEGMIPSNYFDLLWQTPLRVFCFLFKPLLWDIKEPSHAFASLDALLWGYMFILLLRYWRTIKINPCALAVLSTILFEIVVFSYGTGNFGTAIRHRTKFFVMFIAIISPFLIRVRMLNKYNCSEKSLILKDGMTVCVD